MPPHAPRIAEGGGDGHRSRVLRIRRAGGAGARNMYWTVTRGVKNAASGQQRGDDGRATPPSPRAGDATMRTAHARPAQ